MKEELIDAVVKSWECDFEVAKKKIVEAQDRIAYDDNYDPNYIVGVFSLYTGSTINVCTSSMSFLAHEFIHIVELSTPSMSKKMILMS